jgi:hypothetical protein
MGRSGATRHDLQCQPYSSTRKKQRTVKIRELQILESGVGCLTCMVRIWQIYTSMSAKKKGIYYLDGV